MKFVPPTNPLKTEAGLSVDAFHGSFIKTEAGNVFREGLHSSRGNHRLEASTLGRMPHSHRLATRNIGGTSDFHVPMWSLTAKYVGIAQQACLQNKVLRSD